eukprot:sb/3477351/
MPRLAQDESPTATTAHCCYNVMGDLPVIPCFVTSPSLSLPLSLSFYPIHISPHLSSTARVSIFSSHVRHYGLRAVSKQVRKSTSPGVYPSLYPPNYLSFKPFSHSIYG